MRVIVLREASVAWQFFTQTAHPPVECGVPSEWIKSGDLRFSSSNRCVEMGKGRCSLRRETRRNDEVEIGRVEGYIGGGIYKERGSKKRE